MTVLSSFALAYAHLRGSLGRLALSIVAVALGVGLVVAMQLMNSAVLGSFLDTIDGMVGRASLSISAGNDLPFREDLVNEVRTVPGVALAVPLVTAVVFPADGNELLTVQGLDLSDDVAVRVYHRSDTKAVIQDKAEFLNSPNSIVIGREFANARGLQVGSSLDLVLPGGVKTFVVRGLLESEGIARTLAGRIIVMDLYAAEAAFTGAELVNRIDVIVIPGAEQTVKKALREKLPAGLDIEEPALRKAVFRSAVGAFQGMMTVFSLLVCLAGFVICYSRLAAIFEARMWEVGLLRAVGLRRSVVFMEMLKESLLLGVIGISIGLPLGVVIARLGLPYSATATALVFGQPEPAVEIAVTPGPLAIGALAGLLASLASAVVPALRLARRQPLAALTTRGRDFENVAPKRQLLAPLALLAASAALALLQVVLGRTANATVPGMLATVMLAVTTCVAARHVVGAGSRLLSTVWSRLFGTVGELASAHVSQHARRTGMTVATLALGTGLVLLFTILGRSFERTLALRSSERITAPIIVTSSRSGGWVPTPISDVLVERVLEVPGVSGAAGQARRALEPNGDDYLDGYEAACFREGAICRCPLEAGASPDAYQRVLAGTGVILSASMARSLGKGPGDKILIPSPTRPEEIEIVGVTRTEVNRAVIVDRSLFTRLTNDHTISWLHVMTTPGARVETVAEAIRTTLAREFRLRVQTREELLDYFAQQVRDGFATFYVIDVIVALLVMVGIGDLLSTAVLERRRTFAMMRAVGMRRLSVFRWLVLEGATIGTFGVTLGAILGGVLALFWVTVQFPALLGWPLDVHVPAAVVGLALMVMWLFCLGAAVLPGIQAARLVVPGQLRND